MSRLGKILFLIAGFCILISGVFKLILGGWHDFMYVSVAAFFICILISLVVDISFYKEFFTMRTTKHGMNMGMLILLVVVGLIAVNFLAVKRNKKWDITSEGLNSLSDQSIKAIKKIDDKLEIRFFYRGGTQGIKEAKAQFKEIVDKYKDENTNISLQFIESIKRPGLAKEYGITQATPTVFVDYKGKRNKIEPLTEEGVTKALLKSTRAKNKKVYFTKGHGEKSIDDTSPIGINEFNKALKDSGYDVAEMSLLDTGKVADDADAVFIIGPQTSFLEPELRALRDFARSGGRLIIFADPGFKHNMALLSKSFGIEFKNDYILDQFGQMLGASAAMALGRSYGSTKITEGFSALTMFHLASSVQKDASTSYSVEEIVKTGETSFSSNSIANGKVEVQADRKGPHTLGLISTGKLPADGEVKEALENSKEFSVIVYGDSDFLTNQLFFQQHNRDLALNSASYLLRDADLVSIRPKQPKGSTLTLTRTQLWTFIFGIIIPIPLFLFAASGWTWHRRRSA